MSWLVTTDNDQFSAKSLEDLKKKARSGELSPGDLVQPPGARDWLYAIELPEMSDCFASTQSTIQYDPKPSPIRKLFALSLLLGGIGLFGGAYHYYQLIPQTADLQLIGEKGLNHDEGLITTEKASLFATPDKKKRIGYVNKNKVFKLLSKKYGYFQVEYETLEGIDVIGDIQNKQG